MKTYLGKARYTTAENKQFLNDIKAYQSFKEDKIDMLLQGGNSLPSLLLDSSLIFQSNTEIYNTKIIECGDYYQIYQFKNCKTKKASRVELLKDKKLDNDYLFKVENFSTKDDQNKIEYKNIMRSKFQLQRIVKANENIFKTFITLTFADNIKDIKEANKKFNIWSTNIKRIKKDFLYVGVPEFQKRGAVHYHLLTNLSITDNPDIIIPQKNKQNCYDVKKWIYGYSSVLRLENIDVVAYITKYMTKDIDNRLYTHHRYFASRNLKKPTTVYLNSYNDKGFSTLLDIINKSKKTFSNTYLDKSGEIIEFMEIKKLT